MANPGQLSAAFNMNRPSPELRRENGLGATEKPIVAFSNPQANAPKPQETCGSRRYLGRGNMRLENRLEQRVGFESSGFGLNSPPPVPFPKASISPTHAAPQHKKTISDQRVKPCWKNRPTLKLWRETLDSERKSPTIPPPHHQGFWRKARKCSGISKPTQG